MNYSVVIPNWNGQRLLQKNLPNVIKNVPKGSEIIVIDDASSDESVNFLKSNFGKDIRLVVNSKNRGFAQSVNTGFRYAKNNLVCLLNSDVSPEPNFLENVGIRFKSNPKVFAVVLHEKGYGPASAKFKGFLAHNSESEKTERDISLWASGGSSVFRRDLWWKLGGFDDKLFRPFYWEDVDLGYRAWKSGYVIQWEKSALVNHNHESSINKNSFRVSYIQKIKERNELLFMWKNLTSKKLIKQHVFYLIKRLISHPGYVRILLMALAKFKVLRSSRKKVKKIFVMSDEAIINIFS